MDVKLRPAKGLVLLRHVKEEKPSDQLIITVADGHTNTPTGEILAKGSGTFEAVGVGDRVIYAKHSRTSVPGHDDVFLVPESALIAAL